MALAWVMIGNAPHTRSGEVVLQIGYVFPTSAKYRTLELLTDRGWKVLQSIVVTDRYEKIERDEAAVVAELKEYAEYLYGDASTCNYPAA